jgi:hypothetical protein
MENIAVIAAISLWKNLQIQVSFVLTAGTKWIVMVLLNVVDVNTRFVNFAGI